MTFYVLRIHAPFTLQIAENVSMATDLTADFEMVHFEISDPLMITYKKSEVLWVFLREGIRHWQRQEQRAK